MSVAAKAAEIYRPAFHFSPEKNWINDPNGLVFDGSEYHLFYQYNPFGDKWGHMSWGHAVSKDLLRWQELPVALAEQNGVMIFSGSAVVDSQNTSGFGNRGAPPLVALYTGHNEGLQTQNIAYSTDRGRTWTKYSGNPVINIHERDFRDPMVFWHAPTHHWVMVVALASARKVRFYASPDLKSWTALSEFGPAGAKGVPNWECPNIFPLQKKWVLEIGVGDGAPAGGSGCQYFVGDFDGTRFANDNPPDKVLWVDYGADFYAAQTWSDIPPSDGRRIMLAWMNNWKYADRLPTSPWRGQMTFPRVLGLEGARLTQAPVREIEQIRGGHTEMRDVSFADLGRRLARGDWPETMEIMTELKLNDTQGFGFELRKSAAHAIRAGYDAQRRVVYIDRSHSADSFGFPQFATRHEGPVDVQDGRVQMHILLDRSSVELFANHGRTALTDLVYPRPSDKGLTAYFVGSAPTVVSLDIWELRF
jgi:fructan beta-fructosidase